MAANSTYPAWLTPADQIEQAGIIVGPDADLWRFADACPSIQFGNVSQVLHAAGDDDVVGTGLAFLDEFARLVRPLKRNESRVQYKLFDKLIHTEITVRYMKKQNAVRRDFMEVHLERFA